MPEQPAFELRKGLDRPRRCDIGDCDFEAVTGARLLSGPSKGLRMRLCNGHSYALWKWAEESGIGAEGEGWAVPPKDSPATREAGPDTVQGA